MMKNFKVSACIITYNQELYIKDCLEGAINQKLDYKYEIVIGDDCSTDNTLKICQDYASRFPDKIKLLSRTENIGMILNWIDTIQSCNGKYIALCEGDDYWTDSLKLQKQVDLLEKNNDINICFHRANLLQEKSFNLHEIPNKIENEKVRFVELLKTFNFITTASVVFRKPKNLVFPNWFYELPFVDMGLYKIVSNDKYIKCLPETMSVYRIHDNGMWSGLNTENTKKVYQHFYKKIYPSLNIEEKEIVKRKIKEFKRNLAFKRFPKNKFLAKIYYTYQILKC